MDNKFLAMTRRTNIKFVPTGLIRGYYRLIVDYYEKGEEILIIKLTECHRWHLITKKKKRLMV